MEHLIVPNWVFVPNDFSRRQLLNYEPIEKFWVENLDGVLSFSIFAPISWSPRLEHTPLWMQAQDLVQCPLKLGSTTALKLLSLLLFYFFQYLIDYIKWSSHKSTNEYAEEKWSEIIWSTYPSLTFQSSLQSPSWTFFSCNELKIHTFCRNLCKKSN